MKFRNYQSDLLRKVHKTFVADYKRIVAVLPCGAGKTVIFAFMAASSQKKNKTVWFLVHRKELLDQTIDTFDRLGIERKTIHIGMVKTYSNNLHKYPKPDFIVFDECHFSMATTWQKIINAYPDVPIVGLTATPCRLDGKPLNATYDNLIVGISMKQLIREGFLADYKYYAPTVADLKGLKKSKGDYDTKQQEIVLSQRAIFGDVIKHYKELADGKQAICYCSTIKHSEAMAAEFQAAGIKAVHFDGNTPKKERAEIIKRYRNKEITILCNVNLIAEGFDVPDCHCCIMLRKTASTALFIQQSGRALRPQENKTAIVIDHVGNYIEHGMPDDDREWSLTGKLKANNRFNEKGELVVRQCLQCFGTFKTAPMCPYCGWVYEPTTEEIKQYKEIELQEIRQADIKRVEGYKSPDECTTRQELADYAKIHGYKPGWMWHQAQARGIYR
ncbi:MAG: DEAD/DEAH box helicase [Firmicutes bacterium]|nr:DEAD/DEAH box helicase [Bacillota bacterium]